VRLQNFNGEALRIRYNSVSGSASGWYDGVDMERITVKRNYLGVHFGERDGYGNTTQLSCYHNVIGYVVYAGNVKIVQKDHKEV
jgi:hypothetical protein